MFISIEFLALWLTAYVLYYTMLKSHQWLLLLLSSIVFYCINVTDFPWILMTVFVLSYCSSLWISYARKKGCKDCYNKYVRIITNAICIIVWFIGRSSNLFVLFGNSYFTFKAIGYLIDVENGSHEPEMNPAFYLLYLIYFPSLAQGPFNRYFSFKKQFEINKLPNYERTMHGLQRFLYGVFKKLVLCPRLQLVSETMYNNLDLSMNGWTIVLGTVCCSLWYYLDFSGYMDMIIGISETFSIEIQENFKQPFFSKNVAEFWKRWHMTLGNWFKDYILFRFVQSSCGRKIRKAFSKLGKMPGKMAPIVCGTIAVWLFTGIWHGAGVRYLIWALYYCVIIISSLLMEEKYKKIRYCLHVDENSNIYKLFQIARTVILVLIANTILEVRNIKDVQVIVDQLIGKSFWIGDGISLEMLDWKITDVVVCFIGMIIILTVSILKEKKIDVLKNVDRLALPVRWGIYYCLIFTIVLLGKYGDGSASTDFLYMNF